MKERKEAPVCCVVDSIYCLAAANVDHRPSHIGICYACGEPVCRNCSSLRLYPFRPQGINLGNRRRRICNNCQADMDGHEERIKARLNRLAGYK